MVLCAGEEVEEAGLGPNGDVGGAPLTPFTLYSAHDSTLMALTAAMGSPLQANPDLAAALAIELWRTPSASGGKGEWWVSVTLDGTPLADVGWGGKARRKAPILFSVGPNRKSAVVDRQNPQNSPPASLHRHSVQPLHQRGRGVPPRRWLRGKDGAPLGGAARPCVLQLEVLREVALKLEGRKQVM